MSPIIVLRVVLPCSVSSGQRMAPSPGIILIIERTGWMLIQAGSSWNSLEAFMSLSWSAKQYWMECLNRLFRFEVLYLTHDLAIQHLAMLLKSCYFRVSFSGLANVDWLDCKCGSPPDHLGLLLDWTAFYWILDLNCPCPKSVQLHTLSSTFGRIWPGPVSVWTSILRSDLPVYNQAFQSEIVYIFESNCTF